METTNYKRCASVMKNVKAIFISILLILVVRFYLCEAVYNDNSRGRKYHLAKSTSEAHLFRSRSFHSDGRGRSFDSLNSKIRKNFISEHATRRRLPRQASSRNDLIEDAILKNPSLSKFKDLLKRPGRTGGLIEEINFDKFPGTVRTKRLYCRVGIGFHLVIKRRGKVGVQHRKTNHGILEIFSAGFNGHVGIRSKKNRRYLCMRKNGKLFTKKSFQPECKFRENLEKNNYNTYASVKYSDHEKRKGYFLSITHNGKLPKTLKKVNFKQKRAHWLLTKI